VTVLGVALAIGLPALLFTVWPLLRRRTGRTFFAVPADPREQLTERKRQILTALRELDFEHDAGHVGHDDYAELQARYEGEAAEILTALDRLGVRPEREARSTPPVTASRARGWRHPAALAGGAIALLAFGIAIGSGLARNTTPDPTPSMPAPGSRALASLDGPPPAGPGAPTGPGGTQGTSAPRPISPEMLQGMLQAARASLNEGRYNEAIAAYQAILKRQPKNVDAITHLGVIIAIGGHPDSALQAFDRALAIDPNYGPALMYRGQVLFAKEDLDGAIKAWEKFLTLSPSAEDRAKVEKVLAQAKAEVKAKK
jgi:tetratricopeptide (TPR) repeat protein